MEKDIVEMIARSLVANPDEVKVQVVEGEKSTILELKVGQGDVGKVIGKNGVIAKAVRTLINAVSVKNGRRVILEILD
ncbi:MAG: RNA-binding protein [Spirochaetes bacterium GWF1_51_8]|nr:MAG: RNA-binding protein [Spirochaetes bacterium GWF1_51_8]